MADWSECVERLWQWIASFLRRGRKVEQKAKWTVMVYMAGDNNLSAAGEKDLGEMRAVGSTAGVNIVAEFDRVGELHQTQRYHVQCDGVNERAESIGETDCGDPQVLINFVQWAAQEFPAERYGLILWNHGGGWEPAEIDRIARDVRAPNYSEREAQERAGSKLRRAFFRTTVEEILKQPTPTDRAICCDDGSGHSLDTIELGNVLRQAVDLLGQPLDLLGMDACLMSNLEVAYQARSYVKYIVASEENEPNDGWPYDQVLRILVDDAEASTADLAKRIVQAYVQSYVDRNYPGSVTQAALDLAQVGVLTGPLDTLADLLIPRMAAAKFELGETLYRTEAFFWDGTLWDIAEVCEELAGGSQDSATTQAAQGVRDVLQPQGQTFVIAEAHNGSKVARCGGVTIYLPPRIMHKPSRYYGELAFALEHHWQAAIDSYHAA